MIHLVLQNNADKTSREVQYVWPKGEEEVSLYQVV